MHILFWSALCVNAKLIYLIRHAEKPAEGDELSKVGFQRAQCLANHVFSGHNSQFKSPQRIIAQPHTISILSKRPLQTVEPLAMVLGIHVELDCERDDIDCVVKSIQSDGKRLLISWEHKRLRKILGRLLPTLKHVPKYPTDHFDIVWKVDTKRQTLTSVYQDCPNIDKMGDATAWETSISNDGDDEQEADHISPSTTQTLLISISNTARTSESQSVTWSAESSEVTEPDQILYDARKCKTRNYTQETYYSDEDLDI